MSASSPWQSGQINSEKKDSGDTYVEMGNLSCVKSSEAKSQLETRSQLQSDSKKTAGSRGLSSIPKIVLDPGSSIHSIPECEQGGVNVLEDETKEDLEENIEDLPSEDNKPVKVTSSTEIRELYAITPSASFTDSSEEDDGCAETSPLVRNGSTSSTEQPEAFSLKRASCETRPLLSRQLEVDDGSQFSKDTNGNSFDQEETGEKGVEEISPAKVPTTLNLLGNDDELESQRVMPILFTLSPTKKGNNHVVSVVATRDLSAAFSRPPSVPNSPCTRKPKSPRSPKSPKSFRGIFGCRSSCDSTKNVPELNPKILNGNISKPNTAIENSMEEKVNENNFSKCLNSNVSEQNEDVLTNGDTQTHSAEEITNEFHANLDYVCEGSSKETFINTENKNEACNASEPAELIPTDEANKAKSSSVEDALIVFHSEPLPCRVPVLSHRTLQQDSLSEKGSNTNDSFEESTNNSDKGYESVDNSPCVETEESICRSLNTNGAVPSNGITKLAQNGMSEKVAPNGAGDINVITNEPKSSVWVPLANSGAPLARKKVTAITASQPDCNLFSQTAV